jgi:hypothetical protein
LSSGKYRKLQRGEAIPVATAPLFVKMTDRAGKAQRRLKRVEKMYVDQLQFNTVLLLLLSAAFYPSGISLGKCHGK